MAFENPSQALSECRRILRPGGVCAFTTWGGIPWLEDMKAAMKSIRGLPALPAQMDVPNIFSTEKIWHDPDAVSEYVAQRGFLNVESKMLFVTSVVDNADDLKAILKPPLTLMTRFFWTPDERDALDNAATHDRIFAWWESKLHAGPIEWTWSAVVTTSTTPPDGHSGA